MGKFAEADLELANTSICMRCKSRNKKTAKMCRKCGSKYLRPKNRELKGKK